MRKSDTSTLTLHIRKLWGAEVKQLVSFHTWSLVTEMGLKHRYSYYSLSTLPLRDIYLYINIDTHIYYTHVVYIYTQYTYNSPFLFMVVHSIKSLNTLK